MDVATLMPDLDAYLNGVDVERVAGSIAAVMGTGFDDARNHLVTHIGEVGVAVRVFGPVINSASRVLEVGSGIGLFSGFLRSINVDVTELEPVGMGFEFIGAARSSLADYTHPSAHLDIGVEQLDRSVHGSFDLIVSLNVLEHVPDWRVALKACTSVLAVGGQMIHVHPNYTIPYDPHFNVALVPHWPALTSRLLPRRISDSETWSSLNWITAGQLRKWCRANGLEIEFRPGLLAETLERLTTDPLFSKRHDGIVGRVAGYASRLGLGRPLRRLPPTLSSPVEYSLRRHM